MTQIPKEYKMVMQQVIQIIPAANQMLNAVQQVYVDLWNTNYKNKIQTDNDNVALYAEMKKNWKKFNSATTVGYRVTRELIVVKRRQQKRIGHMKLSTMTGEESKYAA